MVFTEITGEAMGCAIAIGSVGPERSTAADLAELDATDTVRTRRSTCWVFPHPDFPDVVCAKAVGLQRAVSVACSLGEAVDG